MTAATSSSSYWWPFSYFFKAEPLSISAVLASLTEEPEIKTPENLAAPLRQALQVAGWTLWTDSGDAPDASKLNWMAVSNATLREAVQCRISAKQITLLAISSRTDSYARIWQINFGFTESNCYYEISSSAFNKSNKREATTWPVWRSVKTCPTLWSYCQKLNDQLSPVHVESAFFPESLKVDIEALAKVGQISMDLLN
jgi:hypothetical protein